MATFPALRPVARQYDAQVYPVTAEAGFGGGEVRFLHEFAGSGATLSLIFEGLTSAELKLIRDHYRGQQGGVLSFALSAEAWAGNGTIPADLGTWFAFWRYASPPEEESPRGGIGNVTVTLVAVT